MNRAKVFTVLRREYIESVRKRSFLFGLVSTPLVFMTMLALPLVSQRILVEEPITIAILDVTGELGERFAEIEPPRTARMMPAPPKLVVVDRATKEKDLERRVIRGEISGWIRLDEDFAETGRFRYAAESVTNLGVLQHLEARAERVLVERRVAGLGLDEAHVDQLLTRAEIKTVKVGTGGGEEAEFEAVYLRAVGLVMMLFFALLPTGHILLRSVIEEKTNRVIEVLVSSVTPFELMLGKILGLGAVGLTLLGSWAAAGAILSGVVGRALPISAADVGIFALYFVPGYFLFAALLGSIGSVVSSEREAQPFLTPLSLMLVFPVMMGIAIAQSPDHWLARALSFFPLLTPSLMLFRYAIQAPPVWEIAATWIVLALSTCVMFWAASRVFRVGILLTGKRPTFPEIVRWAWSR